MRNESYRGRFFVNTPLTLQKNLKFNHLEKITGLHTNSEYVPVSSLPSSIQVVAKDNTNWKLLKMNYIISICVVFAHGISLF